MFQLSMKKKLYIFGIFFSLLTLFTCCIFLLLPYLCDTYLLPRLVKNLPFSEKELSISRISPWKTRATVTLADTNREAFSIPRIELHYSPASLLRGAIDTLLIDSASFHLGTTGGIPAIRGFSVSPQSGGREETTPGMVLPFTVENILIKNCTLTFYSDKGETVNLITNSRLRLEYHNQGADQKILTDISGEILTRGDLNLSGTIKIYNFGKKQEVHLQLEAANIEQLAEFLPQRNNLKLTGSAAVTSTVHLEKLTQVKNFQAKVELSRFRFNDDQILIENRSKETPIALQLKGNLDEMEYSLTEVSVAAPEQSTLDLTGTLNISERTFSGNGQLMVERTQSPFTVIFNGIHTDQSTQLKYELQSTAFQLLDRFSFTPVAVVGNIDIKGTDFSGNFDLQVSKITDDKNQTSLLNTSLHIPFEYPIPEDSSPPTWHFSVEEVSHQGVQSGHFQAAFTPSAQGIAVTSFFSSPFGPDLKVSCSGSLRQPAQGTLTCSVPQTNIVSSKLPPYLRLPGDVSFTGTIKAKAIFNLNKMKPTGILTFGLENGTLNNKENTLSDIKFQLTLPNLPLVESRPSQVCTIGSLQFGTIIMKNGLVHFRIEDAESVFLEKVHLNWCGGKVETGSFRLSGTSKVFETTLYCDRLNFTKLLDQFGIENTEGEGSLNGRLPISINNSSIQFDDGFLFSTPGNSGIVRFNNTDQLRGGLPGMDQAAYLDYSMKAMENFSYNWTKLSFNSQNEELLITMQLDGKPAEPLPYGYKNGHIVPSSAGPGLQHPIRLDVNFRLPLQNMFRYGKNIQSLMENM